LITIAEAIWLTKALLRSPISMRTLTDAADRLDRHREEIKSR
jgi:hypothetical protein